MCSSQSTDLLVLFVRPVLLDIWVTEVLHFIQHGLHECRAKLPSVVCPPLTLVIDDVLSGASVVVETRQVVKKHATTLHVPTINLLSLTSSYQQLPCTCSSSANLVSLIIIIQQLAFTERWLKIVSNLQQRLPATHIILCYKWE